MMLLVYYTHHLFSSLLMGTKLQVGISPFLFDVVSHAYLATMQWCGQAAVVFLFVGLMKSVNNLSVISYIVLEANNFDQQV
mmetsp:Transcript_18569/g.28667  ORF Transcript_18569/g.28667 Transcript_18569/m.28667 type:complete len:81 (-) Transcript_18569:16-258(-)